MSGRVFLGWTKTRQGLLCLAQENNAMTLVRFEPQALWSRVKPSTTEPLRSLWATSWENLHLKDIKLFSFSTQLTIKFQLLIKTKILKDKECSCFQTLRCCFYFADKFHAQLISAWKWLILREYWVLKESKIPLKPVLGGVIIAAISISSHDQMDSIQLSLLFFKIVSSLYFWRIPVSRLFMTSGPGKTQTHPFSYID